MADRQTYADISGLPDDQQPCENCGNYYPRWALVKTTPEDGFEAANYVCGHCLTDQARVKVAALEAADDPFNWSWDSELGNDVRAYRNQLLVEWGWTVRADSPLTTECQAACLSVLSQLQAITVAYARPALVIWPTLPTLEYKPLEEQIPS